MELGPIPITVNRNGHSGQYHVVNRAAIGSDRAFWPTTLEGVAAIIKKYSADYDGRILEITADLPKVPRDETKELRGMLPGKQYVFK
jgi:hypothetical protein